MRARFLIGLLIGDTVARSRAPAVGLWAGSWFSWFKQLEQKQSAPHETPLWKQSQYFFLQRLLRQRHPRVLLGCFATMGFGVGMAADLVLWTIAGPPRFAPLVFSHITQKQPSPHNLLAAKHSQYFFTHFERLHPHPPTVRSPPSVHEGAGSLCPGLLSKGSNASLILGACSVELWLRLWGKESIGDTSEGLYIWKGVWSVALSGVKSVPLKAGDSM